MSWKKLLWKCGDQILNVAFEHKLIENRFERHYYRLRVDPLGETVKHSGCGHALLGPAHLRIGPRSCDLRGSQTPLRIPNDGTIEIFFPKPLFHLLPHPHCPAPHWP
jgi:hypothetical protein